MQFWLDSVPGRTWPAQSFGSPWNGWATPIVTREVLSDMLRASGEPHRWKGDVAILGTPAADLVEGEEPEFWDPIEPDADGAYDLGQAGWTFVGVDDGPPPLYLVDAPARGPSFDYALLPELVGRRTGHGPIWVTWDTNVLSLFETYGERAWALEFSDDEGASRNADPVLTQHDQAEVDALVDLVTMWLGWDLRFEVLETTKDDLKRPSPPEVARRRSRSIRAVAEALMSGIDGEQTHSDLRDFGLPEAIVESLPKGKDRALVAQAYLSGADIFLTCDKGILRRDARIAPWGMRCLSPSALVERLVGAGLRRGFYLDYMLGVAPDLARMSALIGAVEDHAEA